MSELGPPIFPDGDTVQTGIRYQPAAFLLREALLGLVVEVGWEGPLLGYRDVGGQVRRVRGADDGGRQARVTKWVTP